MIDLKPPTTTDFSPIENPCHPLLGYSQGVTYNCSEPREDYPPLLVSKRILELFAHIIKHNVSVTEDLLKPSTSTSEDKLEAVDLNVVKAPIGDLFDLVGSSTLSQYSSIHIDYLLNGLLLVTKVLMAKQKKRDAKKEEAEKVFYFFKLK
jgi:hypothetical protein